MIKINPKKLTKKDFGKFGDVIESKGSFEEINNGKSKSWSNLIPPLTFQNKLGMNVALLRTKKEEFVITFMERHFFTSQVFMPLGGQKYIIVVAPPSDEYPDVNKIESFIGEGNQGINFHPNTWHCPLMPLNTEMEFLCLMNKSNELDLDVTHLEKEIILNVE